MNSPSKKVTTTDPGAADAGETLAAKNARHLTGSAFASTVVLSSYIGTSTEPSDLMKILGKQAAAVQGGDMAMVEAMLINQAVALQGMFADLATRARKQGSLEGMQCYTQLALRAQAGCRTTLQALVEAKNPRQVAFIKQANVAQTQQVNNGVPPSHTENLKAAPIKLLKDCNHDSTAMDTRTKTAASRADSPVGTMEEIHRPKDLRRKSRGVAQRLQERPGTTAARDLEADE